MSEVDRDHDGPILTEYRTDSDGSLLVKSRQEVGGILDHNKEMYGQRNPRANMRKVGSVPIVVWDAWMKEFELKHGKPYSHTDGQTRQRFLKAKLNDRDNAYFRTNLI